MGDCGGRIQALPRSFHQPMTHPVPMWSRYKDIKSTLARELFEELLGGERLVGRENASSFVTERVMPRLLDMVSEHCNAWIVGISFAAEGGNYQLSTVLEIKDHKRFIKDTRDFRRWIIDSTRSGEILLKHDKETKKYIPTHMGGKDWNEKSDWIANWEAEEGKILSTPFDAANVSEILGREMERLGKRERWVHGSLMAIAETARFAVEKGWIDQPLDLDIWPGD